MAVYIFLGLLFLLALLLFAPIEVSVQYPLKPLIFVRIFGINIPIKREKKEAPKAKKKETPEEKAEQSLLQLFSFKEKLQLLKKLLSKFLRYSRKRIQIKNLEISISFGTSDAAKTAIAVGSFWAVLYGILPILDGVFRVKKHNFSITPVYNKETFSFEEVGIIKTRAIHIIFIGAILLIEFMKYKKEVLKNERTSD